MIIVPMITANASQSPTGSPFQFPVMMILLFAIMYVMMIRPQKRREKERKEMLSKVKSGEKVLLTSGIIGHVTNVKEHTIIIRIADNTKIEKVRAAVSQILKDDEIPEDFNQ